MKKIEFRIGDRVIGPELEPYCIAEVGINHNGKLDLALQMIEVAKEAGADAVKFQTFRAEELCGDPTQEFTYQSQGKSVKESMLEMFRRYEFDESVWPKIKKHCEQIGINFFSTPQNVSDLKILQKVGISIIKVGSDDLTNLPLLENYAKSGLPIILSSGMSDISEVHKALEAVGWYNGYPTALLLCTSMYPTPLEKVNASRIKSLIHGFPGLIVGFSDHTQGTIAATIASALGACIFEKHFTLDQDLAGPDHWFSASPRSLSSWVADIHNSRNILGTPFIIPNVEELKNKKEFQRTIVAIVDIKNGDFFSSENIGIRRAPGGGEFEPIMYNKLIGKKAWQNFSKFSPIKFK